MFFNRKKCPSCNSRIKEKYNYCPYCSEPLSDIEKDLKNFGLLGKNDSVKNIDEQFSFQSLGITDKLLNSIFNSLVKNLDKQFKKEFENSSRPEIKTLPNGIKISIGNIPSNEDNKPKKKERYVNKNPLTQDQITRMSGLPRASAKTNIRRLSNKVIYELSTPGVQSTDDVFVSKLEQGYEVKAIGKKKVYVNSLPVELPIKGFTLIDNKLLVEFKPEH